MSSEGAEAFSSSAPQGEQADAARGREPQRVQPKRGKSKGGTSPTDPMERRITTLERSMRAQEAVISELSEQIDNAVQESGEIARAAKEMIAVFGKALKEEMQALANEVNELRQYAQREIDALRKEMQGIRSEYRAHHSVGSSASTSVTPMVTGLKVPKPAMYEGTRSATVVENFLFGLEQYFEAMGVVDDAAKIGNAPNFLRDAAQLWWRRKHTERQRGLCQIQTWDQFKRELRKHFVPHNAAEEAKGKLRRLRQTGSILEYVKEFTTVMLEIDDLSDNYALFQFKDGLKDWAKVELDRRNVQTLDEAIAAAESLTNYSTPSEEREPDSDGNEEEEDEPKGDLHRKEFGTPKSPSSKRDRKFKKKDGSKPPKACFICDGPHWMRDCPNRKTINAIAAEIGSLQLNHEG